MKLSCALLLATTLPAFAQDSFVPLPLDCGGAAPDWSMAITEDGTLFEYAGISTPDLDIAWETKAEGADWPRVLTMIGRGTSAIVILEPPIEGTFAVRVLTQRGETPLLLTGTCAEF